MARGQQQDIAGFRRSHKRIPTRQAMLSDQEELKAKQKAVSSMGQGGAASAQGQGPRKPLSSYQNQMNPIGMGGGAPQTPNNESNARQQAIGNMRRGTANNPNRFGDLSNTTDKFGNEIWSGTAEDITVTSNPVGAGPADVVAAANQMSQMSNMTQFQDPNDPYGWRNRLEEMANKQLDAAASEERIARQRAAQEASVRATMGAGEAGRSGAAALLAGEAGRLAEGQAREAELARELGIAELGSSLMNFDLAKERYDNAEKRQAASSAMWLAQGMDVSYDEAFELLGLPDNAKSDEAREAYERYREDLNSDDDDDDDTEETETTEETSDGDEEVEEERFSESQIPDWVSGTVDAVFAPLAFTGIGPAMGMRLIEMGITGEIENEEDFGAALVDAYGESAAAMLAGSLWRIVQGALGGETPNT